MTGKASGTEHVPFGKTCPCPGAWWGPPAFGTPSLSGPGTEASRGLLWQRNQPHLAPVSQHEGEKSSGPCVVRKRSSTRPEDALGAGDGRIQTEVSLSRSQACQRLSHTTPAGARGGPETARDPSGFSSPSHEHPTSLLGSGRCRAQSCHQREVEVHRGKDEPRARLLQESQELRAMGPHCSLPVGPKDQMAQPSCPHDRRAHNTNACFP